MGNTHSVSVPVFMRDCTVLLGLWRGGAGSLLDYSLIGTACEFGVVSGVGVAIVAAGVEPFLNGKSSNE